MALAARTKETEAANRGSRAKERKGVKREACMTQSIHILHNINIYYNYYNIHKLDALRDIRRNHSGRRKFSMSAGRGASKE